jgi:hypothetical protein
MAVLPAVTAVPLVPGQRVYEGSDCIYAVLLGPGWRGNGGLD